MRLLSIVATLALVVTTCERKPTPPPAPSASCERARELSDARESSRTVLARECGECHTGTLKTAIPRALAVFDLSEHDWSSRMTDAQLADAARRLKEPMGPSRSTAARAISVTETEHALFARFLELELLKRSGLDVTCP